MKKKAQGEEEELKVPEIPENEAERLASLEKMGLVSTPRDVNVDRITRNARRMLGTEIALVSLVDANRQWFLSRQGIEACETPRDISFCGHAINDDATFIVKDTIEDERFRDNPLVTGEPYIRFYAGEPLTNGEGNRIGTLCVISSQPKSFDHDKVNILKDLARLVEIVIENRSLSETQRSLIDTLVASQRDTLIDPLSGLWNEKAIDRLIEREIASAHRNRSTLAVGRVEIDRFAEIERNYPEEIANRFVTASSSILLECLRTTDLLTRSDRNGFLIVLPGVKPEQLEVIGAKILSGLSQSDVLPIEGCDVALSFSIGFGIGQIVNDIPDGFDSWLLRQAEDALQEASEAGGGAFRVSSRSSLQVDSAERYDSLTAREQTVFALLVRGQSNKEVARELDMSVRTVETHRQRVFSKMDVPNIAELVRQGVALGF